MEYMIAFRDKVFTPNGKVDVTPEEVDEHNKQMEKAELEWIRTLPDRLVLYVHVHPDTPGHLIYWTDKDGKRCGKWALTTWLGTTVVEKPYMGAQYETPAFGGRTKRRSVEAFIQGADGHLQRYVGVWCESAQDFVRLRKAK